MTGMKAGFPCSDLNTGSSFISQDIGRYESSVETLEKALGPCIIMTGGLNRLTPQELGGEKSFKIR